MLTQTFISMAHAIERWAEDEPRQEGAHLLVHALETAQAHAPEHVRAFAAGCDENPYARDLNPFLRMAACLDDRLHLRSAMHDIFNRDVGTGWRSWLNRRAQGEGIYFEEEDAGLRRFLECRGLTRECRQLIID